MLRPEAPGEGSPATCSLFLGFGLYPSHLCLCLSVTPSSSVSLVSRLVIGLSVWMISSREPCLNYLCKHPFSKGAHMYGF